MTTSGFAVSLSRRGALARLAGGGLGIAFAIPRLGAAAQDATPMADAGMEAPLLVAWAEAWNSGEADQLLALYAEDGVYEDVPTGTISTGHDEIRAFYEATHEAVADINVVVTRAFQTERWALLEAVYYGSIGGMAFALPIAVVFELEGDKIRRNADYFDNAALLAQITPPEAEATPVA
jgi:steroid delta-isomerase-like uncharacterized protein